MPRTEDCYQPHVYSAFSEPGHERHLLCVAPLPEDETAEARILWRHLQISLYLLGRPPQPGLSWAERPAAMLLEIMRFFLGSPGRPWTDLCILFIDCRHEPLYLDPSAGWC